VAILLPGWTTYHARTLMSPYQVPSPFVEHTMLPDLVLFSPALQHTIRSGTVRFVRTTL
jgi:hypothetical protein